MSISFEKALGIHVTALKARTERASVLANNLANAETPGFKARDLDFKAVFSKQASAANSSGLNMQVTDNGHRPGGATFTHGNELLYRAPLQPSIDGNTVEEHVEHAEYMENSLAFETSFNFVNRRFSGLISALRGE